jgi:hypothetical protein
MVGHGHVTAMYATYLAHEPAVRPGVV